MSDNPFFDDAIHNRGSVGHATTKCDECGETIEIGSWPFCGDHSKAQAARGFEPYYDIGLGEYVTGVGDIKKAMRPHWENDQYIQLDHRDRSAVEYRELAERRAERKANAEKEKRHAR